MDTGVRDARPADAGRIAEIYSQGIEERVATFRTEPTPPDHFAERIAAEPFVVAERDGSIAGWAAAGPYNDGCLYAGVGEAAVYVDRPERGQGIGAVLLSALCDAAAAGGLYKLVALIFTSNLPSIALFERGGFRRVGVHQRHGMLDGEWRDVAVFERSLSQAPDG